MHERELGDAVVAATEASKAEGRSSEHANCHKECASRSVEACPHAHVTQPSSSVTYVFHHSSDPPSCSCILYKAPSLRSPALPAFVLCLHVRLLHCTPPSPARRSVLAISPPCTSTRSLPSLSSPSSPASTLRAKRPLPPTPPPPTASPTDATKLDVHMGCSHGLCRYLWLRDTKPDETEKMQKKEFEARQPIQKGLR